ncbi:MAG: carboxypeptidase regulatory-like domain-containing protein [Candidatus Micrarchaeia archaeon]
MEAATSLNTKIFLMAVALAITPFAAAASTIYGVVSDQNTGAPIAGAIVSVYDNTSLALIGQNTTNASGYYTLTFPDQDANINVTAPNYYADDSMKNVPFASNPGLSTELNFALPQALPGRIVGIATDAATSLPIGGVLVQAIQNNLVKAEATTSAAGAYSLNLPAGTYSLKFYASNYINATWSPVFVNTNATTTRNIVLTPLATVSGNVANTFGEPVANAVVSIGSYSATTDAAGHYTASGVKPGIYLLNVTAPDHYAFTQTNYVVSPGANTKNIVLTPAYGKLYGSINNPTGVMTITLNGSQYFTSTNNASYQISRVAPGTYVAAATTTTPGYSANPATIAISAGAQVRKDFTFNPVVATGSIQGFITDAATGALLAGVQVNYGGASVATNANGEYEVTGLGQGTYILSAGGSSYSCTPASVSVQVLAGTQSHQNFSCTANPTPTITPNQGASGSSGTRLYPTPTPTSTPAPQQATPTPTTTPTQQEQPTKKTLSYSIKKWALNIMQGNQSITLFLSREYTVSADPSSPTGYTSIITLTVENPSNYSIKNFKLSELIPSLMADDPNLTYSVKPTNYANYQAEWIVNSLGASKKFSIYYGVPKKLQADLLRLYANPPLLQLLEENAQTLKVTEIPVEQQQPSTQTALFTAASLPLLGLAIVFFIVVIAVILVITKEAKQKIESSTEQDADAEQPHYEEPKQKKPRHAPKKNKRA